MTGSLIILLVGTLAMMAVAFFIWSWGSDDAAEFRRGYLAIGPNAFEQRIERGDPYLINVHVPYEGEIEGTDVHIPYDKIARHADLPKDKKAELMIYCRSGNMSKIAARTLRAGGYEDIVDLRGGMKAWEAAGKPLVHDPANAAG